MEANKLFTIPNEITKDNFENAMDQAIALELATIPTYLYTYYSIKRSQDQNIILKNILTQNPAIAHEKAQEMAIEALVYANKSAALIMSVVIEEMLHLALSSNVKQAICRKGPVLVETAQTLSFPTKLDGHQPEFPINLAKYSLKQLKTFLQIESPNAFQEPPQLRAFEPIKYKTIGDFYDMIVRCINDNYPGPYAPCAQLLPDKGYYAQNSINTVYYDKDHKPRFASDDDSGDLIGVVDKNTAIVALNAIIEQGEGHRGGSELHFNPVTGMPIPLPMDDKGNVIYSPEDYDDSGKLELSHFAKFMEAYTLGDYYTGKFAEIGVDFFGLIVYNQPENPKQSNYSGELADINELGNALFTYLILMVESCYYLEQSTQFKVFMYGIHKSMIWLLSEIGNDINRTPYQNQDGGLSFEYFSFENKDGKRPKQIIIDLAGKLADKDPKSWGWLKTAKNYLPSLPDVGLDYSVIPNVPEIPA